MWPKEAVDLAPCRSKANKQARLGKGKFALFQMLATGVGEGDICPKAYFPHPWQAGSESFYRQSVCVGGGDTHRKQPSQI